MRSVLRHRASAHLSAGRKLRLVLMVAGCASLSLGLSASAGVGARASTGAPRTSSATGPFPLSVRDVTVRELGGRIVGAATIVNAGKATVRTTTGSLVLSRPGAGNPTGLIAFSVPALRPGGSRTVGFAIRPGRNPSIVFGTYKVLICADTYSQLQRFARSTNCSRAGALAISPSGFRARSGHAPNTIIRKAPANLSESSTGTFRFISSVRGSTFECSLDGGPWLVCRSPERYAGLVDGRHLFEVRAIGRGGHLDPSPAHASWSIDTAQTRVSVSAPVATEGTPAANGTTDPTTDGPAPAPGRSPADSGAGPAPGAPTSAGPAPGAATSAGPAPGPPSDDFNRADGGLGADWAAMGDGGLSIVSNEVVGAAGTYAGDIRVAESYGSDQWSRVEVASTQLSGGEWMGPTVRSQNGGQDTYLGIYFWNHGDPQLRLYERVGGAWTQLGASYESGALPAGTELTLSAVGSQISFQENGVARIVVTDRGLTGGTPGLMTYDVATADNWSGGDGTPPPPLQAQYIGTDANGIASYSFTSPDDGYGTHILRVLAPTHPAQGVPHNFLFVLPVEAELGNDYGDGLQTLRGLDAQDQYNLTIVEPSFAIAPWYADTPDPSIQYETFMTKDLVPWVTQNLAVTGHEQNWLIGFSKSGLGAQDLILKHPDVFAAAASWDFPADMSSYDQYGASPGYVTDANFQANYRLTQSFVDAHKAPFLTQNRIWIGGYDVFGTDMSDYDALLTSEGILHSTETPQLMDHAWYGGWVPLALSALSQDGAALSTTP